MSTTKRELYKEFGKNGFVKDIFISRKERINNEGAFAFVRYCDYGCMLKAIDRLNGVIWNGRRLIVNVSRYACVGGVRRKTLMQDQQKGLRKERTQKWVPVKHNTRDGTGTSGHKQESRSNGRKEILSIWADDQKERPQRSLLGVCVKPIEFRKNIKRITELWGKVVMMDDRTEEAKSFSTARILVDSFQWEMINEWITIKIEDRVFEVFAKEVGPEVYSVESHPDRGEVISETVEDDQLAAVSDESHTTTEAFPATTEQRFLNLMTVNDPLIEVLING
ncbi:hypothetical protein PIB30_012285 [Stylosanthes scabra]|uniref:RRM domain-containing protein n=1 Tax=Stylosanthes scabra TaxID=79078 RepID=A0ABU6X666_9FABA|nr:hypothetical protein [Stylosanthes scabra]